MPYTVSVALEDAAGAFATTPSMTASIFSPPPQRGSAATLIATATNTPAGFLIPFTAAGVPPTGSSVLLVRETAIFFGDLFRSGVLSAYPTPPTGTLTLITPPPPGSVTLAASALAALVAGLAGTTFAFPNTVRISTGVLTGGWIIPLSAAIATATLTPATGTLTLVVTGTLRMRQGFLSVVTHLFTLTMTLTAAPSGDPTDVSRVISIGVTSTTLTATGVPAFIVSALAPSIGGFAAPRLESFVNTTVNLTARGALAGTGKMLSSTAQISALRITITAAGISLLPVVGDLFGPGVVTTGGNLSINISPTPVAGVQQSYVVTLTNTANGTPVTGASIVLVNYDSNGVESRTAKISDGRGQANFTVTLYVKTEVIRRRDTVEVIKTSPTLTVSAAAFNSQEIALLPTS